MFKCSMGPGLGHQGKLQGLCVGSFNNCFGKFVPFFNGSGKNAVFIYISPTTSIYKFKWMVRKLRDTCTLFSFTISPMWIFLLVKRCYIP